ncbi:MAG: aminotransferase class I/II-fold pyridoxal phosphate-dependent enzyme [Gemmatimonadota bacterium]|nr:aminotransferase class I/II-fold pyridoxal phosphate-dependent enzyme [Gemmatimonadota bacterium]
MERRNFLQAGLFAGFAGIGSVESLIDLGFTRRPSDGTVRLSSNENPLGISPAARQAVIDAMVDANRYPGAARSAVVDAVAGYHEVDPSNVLVGNGSTEVLQIMVQLFGQGARIVVADPTFEDVPRYAAAVGVPLHRVPLLSDMSHDLPGMMQAVEDWDGPSIVYLCNPNNPTGTLTSSSAIDNWIEHAPADVLFVVDEAYFDYAIGAPDYKTTLPWIRTKPNVVVVRTFSKVFGMAGMRLGYGLAHADTISKVGSLASHNNANNLACAAAIASLNDRAFARRSIEINHEAREILHGVLDAMGIEYFASHTNFLMHRIAGDLREYIDRMREHGFNVGRPFPPMTSYNRVSFGLPDDMVRFGETLRLFRERGWV